MLCRDPLANEKTLQKGPRMSNNVSRVAPSLDSPDDKLINTFKLRELCMCYVFVQMSSLQHYGKFH